jgi:hypothetical protein
MLQLLITGEPFNPALRAAVTAKISRNCHFVWRRVEKYDLLRASFIAACHVWQLICPFVFALKEK